jgi:hypothetical protein
LKRQKKTKNSIEDSLSIRAEILLGTCVWNLNDKKAHKIRQPSRERESYD